MAKNIPDLVFLIEKIQINEKATEENSPHISYVPIGYVHDKDTAEEIVSGGKTYTKKDSYLITYPKPEFRYTSIPQLDTENTSPERLLH
jgi:hypothetical protein